MARYRRGETFDSLRHRTQCAAKFELLALTFGIIRQQRQLVDPSLKLRRRFRHRRAGSGSMTGFAPIGDGFLDETGLGIMLREDLGLGVH